MYPLSALDLCTPFRPSIYVPPFGPQFMYPLLPLSTSARKGGQLLDIRQKDRVGWVSQSKTKTKYRYLLKKTAETTRLSLPHPGALAPPRSQKPQNCPKLVSIFLFFFSGRVCVLPTCMAYFRTFYRPKNVARRQRNAVAGNINNVGFLSFLVRRNTRRASVPR